MIIHDTDEEDSAPPTAARNGVPATPELHPQPPVPSTRARRPKETQYKLGVGRPTALGGRGPRAVTRVASTAQKGRRTKGSRSVKPTEAAIQEEEGWFLIPMLVEWLTFDTLSRTRSYAV